MALAVGLRASVPLLALWLALPASTVSRENPAPVRSLAEIRQHGVVMQEWDTSCAAAALATLLTYDLHDPVSEEAVALGMLQRVDPLRVRVRGGFSFLDMQRFARARDYDAAGYGGLELEDLRALLPAIVPVDFHGYAHFVVVRRIDNAKVLIADPAFGRRTLRAREFERAWPLKVAFVIEPEQERR
jgi:uncharacterized protein